MTGSSSGPSVIQKKSLDSTLSNVLEQRFGADAVSQRHEVRERKLKLQESKRIRQEEREDRKAENDRRDAQMMQIFSMLKNNNKE